MGILDSRRRRALVSVACFVAAAVVYADARDRVFESRPYLANPGAGRISIRGVTRTPCRWTIVPLTPESPHAEEREPTRIHRIELAHLPRNRRVQVQVMCDGAPVDGGRLEFETEPGPDARPFDFAVLGDSGGFPVRWRELWGYTPHPGSKHRPAMMARRVSEVRPQLFLHTGDVVYPYGERENYARAFFRPFGPLIARTPIAPAIGNHDLKTDGGAPFLEAFGAADAPPLSEGRYGSFDYGPLHVVLLDSNEEDSDLLDRQVAWLDADLGWATRPWKVAVCHVPLWFGTSLRGNEVSDTQQRVSSALWRVCVERGVSVVFAGHQHWYERSRPVEGVVQIVTGGGGEDVRPYVEGDHACAVSAYHFVHGRVEGDTMTLRAIDDGGREIDVPGGVVIRRR